MKKCLFILSLLFSLPSLFGAPNPALYKIQEVYKTVIVLDDSSIWDGVLSSQMKGFEKGQEVIVTDHPEYGFAAHNMTLHRQVSVDLQAPPEPYVIEVQKDYFVLSDGRLFELPSYMRIDVGDQIFFFGYTLWSEAAHVIVYNVTKNQISGPLLILSVAN